MLPSPRWLRTASLALAVAAALPAQDDLAERLFHSGERAYAARSHGEALETWRQLLQQASRRAGTVQRQRDLMRQQVRGRGGEGGRRKRNGEKAATECCGLGDRR